MGESASGGDDLGDYEPTFYHPSVVQADERFELRIDGLPSNERVTIVATLDDRNGVTWKSSAVYEVSGGSVDVEKQKPIDGSFGSADTMAFIQTMEPESGDDPYLVHEDVVLELEARVDGTTLGTSTILRAHGDPEVRATVLDDEFAGVLYEPPGSDSAPGVVTLHGTSGSPLHEQSRMLASNGFVVLALQYFAYAGHGQPSLPDRLVEIPVEHAVDAADWLLDHPRVAGSSVGALGVSRGPELALLAASHFDNISAVVSIGGSALSWERAPVGDVAPAPSWTLDGEPVSHVPLLGDLDWDDGQPLALAEKYTQSYEAADPERIEAATIPVENIDGPLLFVSGVDDKLWDAARFSEPAIERLDEHGHPYEYEHLAFEDVGHAIMTPYRPTANREEGLWMFGGTAEGYSIADKTHWTRTIETLRSVADD